MSTRSWGPEEWAQEAAEERKTNPSDANEARTDTRPCAAGGEDMVGLVYCVAQGFAKEPYAHEKGWIVGIDHDHLRGNEAALHQHHEGGNTSVWLAKHSWKQCVTRVKAWRTL